MPNVLFGISKTGVPKSSPSPDNGRAWRRAGRITTREYPVSGRGEPDIWDCRAVWRDLQRLHRELNDLVEDRTGDLVAEVPEFLVWVLHVNGNHDLRVVTRRHAYVTGSVLAQRVRRRALRPGLAGGAGLGRDRVAGDDSHLHAGR